MCHAWASGQLTVRADSGFYAYAIIALCRKMDVRFPITIRKHKSLRNVVEAIPEADWTPIPLYLGRWSRARQAGIPWVTWDEVAAVFGGPYGVGGSWLDWRWRWKV